MKKILRSISLILLAIVITLTSVNPVTVFAKNTEDIINSAPLKPVFTNYEPLDRLVKGVLKKYTNDGMSTYEKVKACYDYLIKNITYSSNIFDARAYNDIFNKSGYKSEWDKKIAYYAYCALKSKKESCYGYSSAFAVLTRAIGLESYVMQGQTALSRGGYGNHWWVNIKIGGKYYVFDPNVDSNIAKGGTIYYYRFCKLDSEVPDKYIYNSRKKDVAAFNEFLTGNALKVKKPYIKLNKTKLSLKKGKSYKLKAKLSPNFESKALKWKTSNKKIVKVSKDGKITAVKKGKATVTAYIGSVKAKCKITVK